MPLLPKNLRNLRNLREKIPVPAVPAFPHSRVLSRFQCLEFAGKNNKNGAARCRSSHKICAICGICVRKFPFPPFPRSRIPVFCRAFSAWSLREKITKMERQDAAPPIKSARSA